MGSLAEKFKRRKPWDYRKEHRVVNKNSYSHYPPEIIGSAMKVLHESREGIQAAIFDYADTINGYMQDLSDRSRFVAVVLDNLWIEQLSTRLLPNFLKNAQHREAGINALTISTYYSNKADFYKDLHNLMSGNNYPIRLRKINSHLSAANFDPGWSAILREFGLFESLGIALEELTCALVQTPTHEINPGKIVELIEREDTLAAETFEKPVHNKKIRCPAFKQVHDYIGRCAAYNIALATVGAFSKSQRVDLINVETGHFKSLDDMAAQFNNTFQLPAVYDKPMVAKGKE